MKNLFKNPKTRIRNLLLLIAPFIVIIIVCVVVSINSVKTLVDNTSGTSVTYKDSIDSMDYHLRSNPTDLQEDLFKELTDAVNDGTNKGEIAKLVCENFVADFYTWTNKYGTYDVGGMYYVYSPQKTGIYNQARNQFYKYLTYYIDTYGSENLLEVETIEATVGDELGTYEYDGKSWTSYYVIVNWTYKNLDTFSDISSPTMDGETQGFVTENQFTVIENEDGRFEIVRAWED